MCFLPRMQVLLIVLHNELLHVQVSRLQSIPGLRTIANLPVVSGFLTSFLPSVSLRIFLARLPNLLSFMTHLQGMTSLSQIDFGVMRKYFVFQVSLRAISQGCRPFMSYLQTVLRVTAN